jgi:hypothetical protein
MRYCLTVVTTILLVVLVVLTVSCSSQKNEWNAVEKLSGTTYLSLGQSNIDVNSKLFACESVINALSKFLVAHPDGEYADKARKTLKMWQDLKAKLRDESQIVPLNETKSDSINPSDTTPPAPIR